MVRVALAIWLVVMAAGLPAGGQTASTEPSTQPVIDVGAEVQRLRGLEIPAEGRGPLVTAYEKLIAQAGDDPKAVDAMMDLAALWEVRDEQRHIDADPDEALKWYRRAADAAGADNPLWAKSRFRIVWLIQSADPDGARKILDDIENQTHGEPEDQAQVQSSLLTLSLHEKKLDEAEDHARKLFGWYDSPGNIPADDDGKAAVDAMISHAAGAIVDAVVADSQTAADDRVTRIRRMMDDFPTLQALQDSGQGGIEEIQKGKGGG